MTAEELINKRLYVTIDGEPESVHDSVSNVKDTMIEFAKYHVEQALLRASTGATTKTEMVYTGGLDPDKNLYEPEQIIDEDSILNAYPLENIK